MYYIVVVITIKQRGFNMKNKAKAEIFEKTKRNIMNQTDSRIITSIYDAIHYLDVDIARSVIAEPGKLEGMLVNDCDHEIICFYALHALMAPLCAENVNHNDILNSMNDRDIADLKRIILIAQKRSKPVKEDINKVLSQREATKNGSVINAAMIQSLKIYLEVESAWQDSSDELAKLLNSIDNFKRDTNIVIESEKNTVEKSDKKYCDTVDKQDTYWIIDELVEKLGYKNRQNFNYAKKQILKKHKRMADKIQSWFCYAGQGSGKKQLLFKSENFKQLQKLFTNTAVTKVTKQNNTEKNTIVLNQPADLLEIKALETFLVGLQKSCESAKQDWEHAEVVYKKIAGEAIETQDLDKRTELIGQINKANNGIKDSKQKFESLSAQLQEAQNLLQERELAEKALSEANKSIANFLSRHGIIRE